MARSEEPSCVWLLIGHVTQVLKACRETAVELQPTLSALMADVPHPELTTPSIGPYMHMQIGHSVRKALGELISTTSHDSTPQEEFPSAYTIL